MVQAQLEYSNLARTAANSSGRGIGKLRGIIRKPDDRQKRDQVYMAVAHL